STAFFDQLDDYFKENTYRSKRRDARDFMDRFERFWFSGLVDSLHRGEIYATCDAMLQERMRPYPSFHTYLSAAMSLIYTEPSDSLFLRWQKSIKPLIDLYHKSDYVDYLKISHNLFAENRLYEKSSLNWAYKADTFQFVYDSAAYFIFPKLDLSCYAFDDSTLITNTSGTYYPMEHRWEGKGGRLSWRRAGLPVDSVYAELGNYTIDLTHSSFSADSVAFHNKLFFDEGYLGSLEEKLLSDVTPKNAIYPRFYSYTNEIFIPALFGAIDYSGGFAMEGAKVIGTGVEKNDATLTVNHNDSVYMQFNSKRFIIRENKLTANRTEFSLFHGNDSIYHPGLSLKYLDGKKELSVYRDDKGLAGSPFYNSYHNIDMYPEAFYWTLGADSVSFSMLRGISRKGKALFESSNFFSADRYYQLQGIDEIHPMNVIYQYWKKRKKRTFYLFELQNFMDKPEYQVKNLLIRLTQMGFVLYNIEGNKVTIKDRLFFYLKALAGRSDYDVIQFLSQINSGNNAILDLSSFDLKLRGVPRVSLSRNRQVYIFPEDRNIILKKGMDFIFTGRVQAGYFDFFANECSFEYDKFQLNLHTVDSLAFYVPVKSKRQPEKDSIVRVKNVISRLNGNLSIDHPNNKSGEKPYPKYPEFSSKDDAYVYYDDKNIAKGVYKRDTFYYHVEPFTIDSLDKITTEGIAFNGFLVSGGIFPDIDEPLKVQPDFSLGFQAGTTDKGLPVYDSLGKYYEEIELNYKGLTGKGRLDYLTSEAHADEFHFYPDSVKAFLNKVSIAKAQKPVEFPRVYGEKARLDWKPYDDKYVLNNSEGNLFMMYDDKATMDGTLTLKSTGMTGMGKLNFDQALMQSETFAFKHHTFDTDSNYFRLRDVSGDRFAIATYVNSSHVDLEKRIGNFITTGGSSRVVFPANRYMCYMDEFDWYMDDNILEFRNNIDQTVDNIDKMAREDWIDIDLSGSQFISTHPDQDSLSFFALSAQYDIDEHIIKAHEVKIIRVADAAVFPHNGKVTINHNAVMKPLRNAMVISDTATKYHHIYEADIRVKSRHNYVGKGFVDYENKLDEIQSVYLDTIMVEEGRTHGIAKLDPKDKFQISPHFEFAGNIHIYGGTRGFNFDGGYRVINECDDYAPEWVQFSAEVDPDKVMLPVDKHMQSLKGDSVIASLNFLNTSNALYPVFFNPKAAYIGESLIEAHGFVMFDEVSDEYRIGTKGRLMRDDYSANYLAYATDRCIMKGEGMLDPGVELGQVNMQTYGKIRYFSIPDSIYMGTYTLLNLMFSDEALQVMTGEIRETELRGVEPGSDVYEKSLKRLLGNATYDDVMEDLQTYGRVRDLPDELNKTFTFSDLQFDYYKQTRSFVSQGQIGIGTIGGEQINRYVDGTIEIARKRTGDEINIYLELDSRHWYFFNYTNGVMQAISTNNKFNNVLIDIPEDKRTMDTERRDAPYQYIISTQMKRMQFVRKIQRLRQ
ncbi:MAG: hypothetical protein K9I94_15340, partial [Bacteroidales bacterium]|nr:hypothetical protein [Bacteroidales bacterium]